MTLASAAVLDTVVTAETPEGILLELRPAGLNPRLYAFLLDWAVRLAVLYGVAIITEFLGGLGAAVWLILFFLLEWGYPVVFELLPSGATPGKRVFGLRVVMDDGLPVTVAASVTRNLLRFADFLPLLFGFAIVTMLTRRDCKRLGDIAAATLVVHDTRPAGRPPLQDVTPLPPARPLTQAAQAALVALAVRAPRLTSERLDELAAMAAEVSNDAGRSGHAVTQRVLGVGHWILGRRP